MSNVHATPTRRLNLVRPALLAATVTALGLICVTTGCDKKKDSSRAGAEQAEARQAQDKQQGPTPDKPGADPESAPSADETIDTLDELPEGTNVLQHEMRKLNAAMRDTLTHIANDNLQAIPKEIKKVHPARQLTMKAVKKDAYRPPVNGDDMEGFKELDDRFHDNLKRLLKAAKDDDLRAATDQYSELVNGCTDCHLKYRFDR